MEQEKALAKLSLAAICIDLLLSISFWRMGMEFLAGPRLPPYVAPLALVGVMVLHLFAVEVLFGGRSLGRLCCGLTVSSTRSANEMPIFQRLTRFVSILMRFGLGSLNPNRLPSYNCVEGVCFRSDLAGEAAVRSKDSRAVTGAQSPASARSGGKAGAGKTAGAPLDRRIRGARLIVTAGPHKGADILLASGKSFLGAGIFNVGRTAGWSDFAFDQDSRVSSRQCRIYRKGDSLFVADGPETSKPSRNGTFLNGKPVSADAYQRVIPGSVIRIGESAFELVF